MGAEGLAGRSACTGRDGAGSETDGLAPGLVAARRCAGPRCGPPAGTTRSRHAHWRARRRAGRAAELTCQRHRPPPPHPRASRASPAAFRRGDARWTVQAAHRSPPAPRRAWPKGRRASVAPQAQAAHPTEATGCLRRTRPLPAASRAGAGVGRSPPGSAARCAAGAPPQRWRHLRPAHTRRPPRRVARGSRVRVPATPSRRGPPATRAPRRRPGRTDPRAQGRGRSRQCAAKEAHRALLADPGDWRRPPRRRTRPTAGTRAHSARASRPRTRSGPIDLGVRSSLGGPGRTGL